MHYKLLGMMLVSTLLLSGCFGGTKDTTPESIDITKPVATTETPSLEDCKTSLDQYLLTLSDMKKGEKTISQGDNIVVDYVGRLEDGSVFDTSVESVARGCGLYTAGRDYGQGLAFAAGAGQMIAGFDAGVIGMTINETKTITIPSDQAYGGDTISGPVEDLPTKPDGATYTAGESIMTMNGPTEILTIDGDTFTISNPHPLAGKDLIFDITIKAIQ